MLEDKNLKGFITNKKFAKTVVLINNKKVIKNVFLNLDISTLAFGFIPSLFRKKYDAAVCIFILQILNFFIIGFPFSILTNFTITGIASIITAKDYLNYLVDSKNFIPYAIWKDMNNEDEYVDKQIILESKRSELVIILSLIFIVVALSFSLICEYKNLISGAVKTTNNDEIIEESTTNYNTQMIIKNNAIITMEHEIIHSVLILNSDANNDLDGVVYPGNIQVQVHNTTDELNKLVDVNNIDTLKEIFKGNFSIEIKDFLVINKDDDKDDINFYQDILSKILKVHENDIDNRIRNLEEKYSDLDEIKIKEFYNSFKDNNVDISELKYDTVMLGDIVEVEILEALDLLDKVNYEFITVDKSILENNEEIKSIREKYNEYLESKKEEAKEEILDEDSNDNNLNNQQEEIITPAPPANGGQTGGSEIPPTNNGQTGGIPPVNDGQTDGGVKPPEEDTEPPSDNVGGEGIKPPADSENINENTSNQINVNEDSNIQ